MHIAPPNNKDRLALYYKDKDELYLTGIRECFDALTEHLRAQAFPAGGDAQDCLAAYFDARLAFFQENPLYQRLFFEAILSPPVLLAAAIAECKAPFDTLNHSVFRAVLERVPLRPDMNRDEVIETLRQYQDFVNATTSPEDMTLHEQRSRRAVSVLLYGVAARKEEKKRARKQN